LFISRSHNVGLLLFINRVRTLVNRIKMIKAVVVLLIFNSVFAQKYDYKEISLRDFKGDFITVEKAGEINILADKILLFDQELSIKSKRIIFDEKGAKIGLLYSCSDGLYWYSVLITNDNILYFKNKEIEMFRIKITIITQAEIKR